MKWAALLGVLGLPVGVFAAEPDWSYLAQFGVLGLVVIALLGTKHLVPGWTYRECREQVSMLQAEVAALRADTKIAADKLTSEVVPALIRATDMGNKQADALERAVVMMHMLAGRSGT